MSKDGEAMITSHKHHAIVAAVVALALISLSGCGAAVNEPEPPSGPLLFQWVSPGKDTIFIQASVESDPIPLSGDTLAVNDVHPDWSPDGKQIAFVAEFYGYKEIWIADGDGSNPRRLYAGTSDMPWAEHPAWSPDGRRIAFEVTDREPTYEVSTRSALIQIDVTSGETVEIASRGADEGILSEPRWSPDGTAIVCSLGRFDRAGTTFTGQALAVLRYQAGVWSDPQLITDYSDFAGYADWGGPDGRIVFATGDPSGFFFIVDNHKDVMTSDAPTSRDIFTISADGSNRLDVTAGTEVASHAGQPSWAPDGRIAFTAWSTGDDNPHRFAMINDDGTGLRIFDVPSTHTRVSPAG